MNSVTTQKRSSTSPTKHDLANASEGSINHITLVRTPIVSSVNSFSAPVTAPIALAYLSASLIEGGFDVSPIDAVGEAIDEVRTYEVPPCHIRGLTIEAIIERIPPHTDLIALSCMFSQEWLVVRGMIERIGEAFPDVPIVLGGEHATAVPEEILKTTPSIDLCACGEGEELLVDIARNYYRDVKKIAGIAYRAGEGRIVKTPARTRIRAVENIPRPAWHLLPLEAYLERGCAHGVNAGRSIPILATRGCPYQCTFCSNKNMWTQRYYTRCPHDVIDEIETYIKQYKIDSVEFFDLTAIVKKEWILEFGSLLKEKKLGITWSLPSGTRSEVLDDNVTKLMAETNCLYLAYAAESGSPRILKYIKKQVKLERMMKSMRDAKQNGLIVRCNLMLGFPEEKRTDILKTLWFQMKLAFIGVDDAPLYMFSPYPGTALFNDLRAKGVIPALDDDYFRSLLCQMDLTQTSGYCYRVGPRELALYRFVGMSLFYSFSYLFFPKRIVRSIKNIFITRRTETVFEQRIVEKLTTDRQVKNALRTKSLSPA